MKTAAQDLKAAASPDLGVLITRIASSTSVRRVRYEDAERVQLNGTKAEMAARLRALIGELDQIVGELEAVST